MPCCLHSSQRACGYLLPGHGILNTVHAVTGQCQPIGCTTSTALSPRSWCGKARPSSSTGPLREGVAWAELGVPLSHAISLGRSRNCFCRLSPMQCTLEQRGAQVGHLQTGRICQSSHAMIYFRTSHEYLQCVVRMYILQSWVHLLRPSLCTYRLATCRWCSCSANRARSKAGSSECIKSKVAVTW